MSSCYPDTTPVDLILRRRTMVHLEITPSTEKDADMIILEKVDRLLEESKKKKKIDHKKIDRLLTKLEKTIDDPDYN